MSNYLAVRCPQCSKWIPIRRCDTDAPTFEPTLFMQVVCPHCRHHSKLMAAALEVVPESKLQLLPPADDSAG